MNNDAYDFLKSLPDDQKEMLRFMIEQKMTEQAIMKARYDPNFYVEYTWPIEGGKYAKQSWFHRRWMTKLTSDYVNCLLILAFRGSAKSEQIQAAITWLFGHYSLQGKPPDYKVKYIAGSESIARNAVAHMARHMKESERYRAIFPDLKPATHPWSAKSIGFQGRTSKDANIAAYPVMGVGVGGRSNTLAFDDVVTPQNAIEKPSLQDKLRDVVYKQWFPTIRVSKNSPYPDKKWWVATPWTTKDMTAELMHNKVWNANMEFVPVYNRHDRKEYQSLLVKNDGGLAWPEEMDERAIRLKRIEIDNPAHFESQMLLNPIDEQMTLFSRETIQTAEELGQRAGLVYDTPEFHDFMSQCSIVVGVDLAIAKAGRSSYTVLWVGAVDANYTFWPVEIIREKMKPHETIGMILKTYERYHPQCIMVECNAFQRMLYQQLEENAPNLPWAAINTGTNKVQPEIGIPPMAGQMAQGRIGIPMTTPPDHPLNCICKYCKRHRPGCGCPFCIWKDELSKFGIVTNFDTVMAMWFAWTAAGRLISSHTGETSHWGIYDSKSLSTNMIESCEKGCGGKYYPLFEDGKTSWTCNICGDTKAVPGRSIYDKTSPVDGDDTKLDEMMMKYFTLMNDGF